MSAEFMTEYNDSTIIAAIGNMERTMRSAGPITEYIQAIQERYAQLPNGVGELSQMIRFAQFITQNEPKEFGEEVQAVYHGELLGLELINYLEPDNSTPYKGGFAQAFLKHRMDESRPIGERAEGYIEHRQRLYTIARSMQIDLSPPSVDSRILNPLYEEFGQQATTNLTDNLPNQYLAMMGFRMVVTEALSPSMNQTTSEALDRVEEMTKGRIPTEQDTVTVRTIQDLEKVYVPNNEVLESILPNPGELEWEDITHIRKTFMELFMNLEISDDEFEDANVTVTEALENLNRAIETKIATFNQNYELINDGDLVSVTGKLFVIVHDLDGTANYELSDTHTEIRGIFEGIHLDEVPTVRELKQALNKQEETKPKRNPKYILRPMLRLVDPVRIISYSDPDMEPLKEQGLGCAIDIPLNYIEVTYKRIAREESPDDLENDL